MKISYYPGCTLKTNAKHFEETALPSLRKLGVELVELDRWNCCGTVFSFTTDNVMYHLAPVRNLLRAREQGYDAVFTLCSMCYNTLKRANRLFNDDAEKNEKIRNIMYMEDIDYDGSAKVIHILELLRDSIGMDKVKEKVQDNFKNMKLAPYYGCMLLRPDGMGVDDAEDPSVFEEFIRAIGADPVYFPFNTECCGAYQTALDPEIVAERTLAITESALNNGAEAIVVSCPLCAFNLDQRQAVTAKKHPDFTGLPVLYLTECLYLALGLPYKDEWKELHHVPIDGILKKAGKLPVSGKGEAK